MTSKAWLGAILISLGQIPLAESFVQAAPPPPPPPSGAEILGSPGIRTIYGEPPGQANPPPARSLRSEEKPVDPLIVPVSETVDFHPSIEKGPFQRPTVRGMFRWDLQQATPK